VIDDISLHDDDPQRASRQAALDHSWAWFALHARQRMQCVNFFFVAVAFLAAGYVTALTRGHPGVAVGIGVLGAWLAGWFYELDGRTRELVDAGEEAMAPLQQRLAQEVAVEALELVKRVKDAKGVSYGKVLRVLHGTAGAAFLLGAVYALAQSDTARRYGRRWMSDPTWLTGIGLGLGFLAAILLTFLPPPHFSQYTKDGAARITWTGRTTLWGRVLWWLSYSGPILLAASFALQFLAWWRR
jgi:multisubunit Na+/H+ antiporter MnhB subunit